MINNWLRSFILLAKILKSSNKEGKMDYKNKDEKKTKSNGEIGFWGSMAGITLYIGVIMGGGFENKYNINEIQAINFNNDSLIDLKLPDGRIYLQTNEGTFVSYDSIISQEKAKIDSTYKMKLDSIENKYVGK